MDTFLRSRRSRIKSFALLIASVCLLAACQPPQIKPADITVQVTADGMTKAVSVPAGSTVQNALDAARISLGQIDQVAPPAYAVLSSGDKISVIRVEEQYETEQAVVPFDRQELKNESLPAGESLLIQAGQNGLDEITIRHVYENGIETGESTVSDVVLKAPIPEILMIGVQNPFTPVSIPGILAYLTGGNAWIMQESTSNRRPLVTSGDLDGRIFSLSPDGHWLLFSRKSSLSSDQEINTLWVVSTTLPNPTPIDLRVANVVHFAAWQPGAQYTIAYSTVEPQATAPGWQANNDLYLLQFDGQTQTAKAPTQILDSSAGGVYGWWGMSFAWSPDGQNLAYVRPDEVGLVDQNNKVLDPLQEITPLNTYADWAWTPGLAWGSDSHNLYMVVHAPSEGLLSPEDSPNFDLVALSLTDGAEVDLVQKTGMFAYPVASPVRTTGTASGYQIAFLQAIFPAQSATSRYRLWVMDQDGSNAQALFPAEGLTGLEPQNPVWAPSGDSSWIAVLYDSNLWLVDASSGQSQQVTGDGLTSCIDWK
jgi:hypothetical protein